MNFLSLILYLTYMEDIVTLETQLHTSTFFFNVFNCHDVIVKNQYH